MKNEIIEIADQVFDAFKKSPTAGFICMESLVHLDQSLCLEILIKLFDDERIDEYTRHRIYNLILRVSPYPKAPAEKNLPVKELVRLFNDKKSGKVGLASKQMKDRFMYLEYNDQKLVIKTLINASSSYRKWCYRALKKWREPLFDDTLIEHWKEYGEAECLETLIDVLPTEKFKSVYPLVGDKLENRLHSKLLERFGREEWIDIDKEWLKETSPHPFYYLRTMAKTKQELSKNECLELLYNLLQEEFADNRIDSLWRDNERYADESGNTPPRYYHFENVKLRLPQGKILLIRDILDVFAQIGHYDVVASLVNWGEMTNQFLETNKSYDGTNSDENWHAICKEQFTEYIRLLRENMLQAFKDIGFMPTTEASSINESNDTSQLEVDPRMQEFMDVFDLEIDPTFYI